MGMLFDNVRSAWKKRAIRHLIEAVGKEDWCTFVKALCNSSDICRGFPYECKACFDSYFNPTEILQHALEQENY
jgi:hypothetical protein